MAMVTAVTINASKAVHIQKVVTLEDGTQTMITLQGDEHVNYFISAEGDIILCNGDAFHKATKAEVDSIRALCERVDEENRQSLAKIMHGMTANNGEVITGTRLFPHMGTPKVPVIVVQFQDTKLTFGLQEFDRYLNSTEINGHKKYESYGSVAEYFNFCSNGKFRPQFDLYGPYTMSGTTATYGAGNDNMGLFIPEACKLADKDIDFSEYDQDGDGYCDLVYVIYAGYGANMTSTTSDLWPKSGTQTYKTEDGVSIYRYGISNELIADRGQFNPVKMTGIGVFCHEFSHTMGMPDFYPTVSWSDKSLYNNQSLEEWSVMDGGENVYGGCYPTPYTAWERELMGWTEKMPELNAPSDVELMALQEGGSGYRIRNDADETGNEYYILENVPNTGWYYKMPNKGMIVTHLNYDVAQFSNFAHPNNTQGKPRITILPADGLLLSSYMIGYKFGGTSVTYNTFQNEELGDPYPGSKNVTSLTNWKNYIGDPMDKPVTDIAMNENDVITFKFMGGSPLLMGDADGDGMVTMNDANIVVNHYLDNSIEIPNPKAADVNGDGIISMSDANAIVNIYLE